MKNNIDLTKKSLESRLEQVNKVIENEGLEDIDLNDLVSPSKDRDSIALEKYSKKIESLANALLGSEESRLQRKKTKYKFYTNEEEFKVRSKRETENINAMASGGEGGNVDDVIHFLKSKNNNYKKSKLQTITVKDLNEDSECGRILREYQMLQNKATHLIRNPHETTLSRFQLTNIKGTVKQDMLNTKDMMNGTFGWFLKNPMVESETIDWDLIDLQDPKHIRALLYINMSGIQYEDDLSLIMFDLNKTIKDMHKEGKLNKKNINVITMVRQGWKLTEIAEHYDVSLESISMMLTRASEKIVRYHKKKGIR